jgi:hypothetical protein
MMPGRVQRGAEHGTDASRADNTDHQRLCAHL